MKKFSKILALILATIISVSAFSISGFAVATPLEAGDSMENAANIPKFGVDYVSTLSEAEEVDWFKFTTLEDDAYYHFYFENYSLNNTNTNWANESPNLYLYDINKKELEHIFTYGDKKDSFSMKLENNTDYYIKVLMGSKAKNSTGNYQITLSTMFDSASDSMEKAKFVELNNTVISSFDGYADVDWYCFETADVKAEYNVKFVNYDLPNTNTNWDTDSPNMYLYDKNMQEIDSCYTKPNLEGNIDVTLESNTKYYLKLFMGKNEKDAVGKYEFTVSCDDVIVEPDIPDTPVQAALSSISISSLPTKTIYRIGEEFAVSGLKVKAFYDDGTSKNVTDYALSGFDSSSEGIKTVTVSYSENGKTVICNFTVEVKAEENNKNEKPSFDVIGFFTDIFMKIIDFFIMIIDAISNLFSMV